MSFITKLGNHLCNPVINKIAPFAVAVGIVALASCANPAPAQPVQTPTKPVQPPAQTQTYQPQTYDVKGTIYHDYNGDGIKEPNEPAIPWVELDWYRGTSLIKSINADSNGNYDIHLGEKGTYTLIVDKNNILGYDRQPFRYINISKADFKKITDSLNVDVNGDMNYDVALMQGSLTLPFGPDTKFLENEQFGIEYYRDWDVRLGYAMNWKGETGHVYDGSKGTDFEIEENTPILAAAPGIVVVYPSEWEYTGQYDVAIQHQSPSEKYYFTTVYGHLNKSTVKVGQKVNRGDVIGLSGKSIDIPGIPSYGGKRLHFEVNLPLSIPPHQWFTTDIYRPILPDTDLEKAMNFYMQQAAPYGFKEEDYQKLITVGYLTKDNDPQYPNLSGP